MRKKQLLLLCPEKKKIALHHVAQKQAGGFLGVLVAWWGREHLSATWEAPALSEPTVAGPVVGQKQKGQATCLTGRNCFSQNAQLVSFLSNSSFLLTPTSHPQILRLFLITKKNISQKGVFILREFTAHSLREGKYGLGRLCLLIYKSRSPCLTQSLGCLGSRDPFRA